MIQIFKTRTRVMPDLQLALRVESVTLAPEEYRGIRNEVVLLVEEDVDAGRQPQAQLRVAMGHEHSVHVLEVGVKALAELDVADWPMLRQALASVALCRMSQLFTAAGITMPAVLLGEEQPISEGTARMLLGSSGPAKKGEA